MPKDVPWILKSTNNLCGSWSAMLDRMHFRIYGSRSFRTQKLYFTSMKNVIKSFLYELLDFRFWSASEVQNSDCLVFVILIVISSYLLRCRRCVLRQSRGCCDAMDSSPHRPAKDSVGEASLRLGATNRTGQQGHKIRVFCKGKVSDEYSVEGLRCTGTCR
jgi:hypothetical protein